MDLDLMKIMETVTLVVTVGMFMTGISPCMNMYKTKSTRNVPYPMFLMSAISCFGMFHYGLMLNNAVLIFLNAIGAVLQSLYSIMYIIVVKSKVQSLFFLFLGLVYNSVLYLYLYGVLDSQTERADKLGMCSSLLTTGIMCFPALEVISDIIAIEQNCQSEISNLYGKYALSICCMLPRIAVLENFASTTISNIRHKNAEGMPRIMLFGGIACSSCWLVYGMMLNDPNVYTPNIPGLFISSIKLLLIALYEGKKQERPHRD